MDYRSVLNQIFNYSTKSYIGQFKNLFHFSGRIGTNNTGLCRQLCLAVPSMKQQLQARL